MKYAQVLYSVLGKFLEMNIFWCWTEVAKKPEVMRTSVAKITDYLAEDEYATKEHGKRLS